ncbi:hypothetical protein [Amycolatopsis sp. PS_44_ISF1]|uniref:hypothetical protein n=1 Tax=Amycolatopsis sp. PS_44_ISF1 TaxID=2974917 RepID=UPI0028DEEE27|nr:hypothetical protein [Amycolatopsis sp. PS_44_ISF1]MDT8913631.1 hypothetical protein [Amycolatopsis sp. PS_44_ISF1]
MSWTAEWGIRDDSPGVEQGSENLGELVAVILDDLRSRACHSIIRLEWTFEGDPPEKTTIENEIARLGVALPATVTT